MHPLANTNSSQHAAANALAVEFANGSRPRKPQTFGDAFEFFGAKIRLGMDPERIRAAFRNRDPTHSPSQFWIAAGLSPPPWEKPKRSQVDEHAAIKAALESSAGKLRSCKPNESSASPTRKRRPEPKPKRGRRSRP